MGSYAEHQNLIQEILVTLSKNPRIRVWQHQTGMAKSIDFSGEDEERVFRYGLKGSADIIGILGPRGRMLCIEVKTGNAVTSPRQKNFRNTILERGGVYIVARSVLDAVEGVTRHDEGG